MEHSQEDAQEAIMPSAASVTLDLDVVMDQMRSSMGQNAQAGCPGQLIPGSQQQLLLALHRARNAGGLNTRQVAPKTTRLHATPRRYLVYSLRSQPRILFCLVPVSRGRRLVVQFAAVSNVRVRY